MPHPSVPPSLATALRAAGFRNVVVVERLDGQPLSPTEEALARIMRDLPGKRGFGSQKQESQALRPGNQSVPLSAGPSSLLPGLVSK